MLPTDAPPRPDTANGELVPLAEQDCTLWDVDKIAEGVALITKALPRRTTGPYQLQAAIAQSTTRPQTLRNPLAADQGAQ